MSKKDEDLIVDGKISLDEMLLETKSLDSAAQDVNQLSIGLMFSEGPPQNLLEEVKDSSIKLKGQGSPENEVKTALQ